MRIHLLLAVFAILFIHQSAIAQCDFDPVIEGDPLLCPNGSSVLSTQEYDSYQWFHRPYPNGTEDSIAGETGRELLIDESDVLYYISVDAEKDGCIERSPEVLVDGLVFLPVTVATSGDFEVGPNGEAIICMEDTVYFTIQLPYDTLITWFRNGIALNEDSTTLAVSTEGTYTVSGSPSECPGFQDFLGVSLEVETIDCSMANEEIPPLTTVRMFPNPATDYVHFKSPAAMFEEIRLFDQLGKLVIRKKIQSNTATIDLSTLAKGVYQVLVVTSRGTETGRLLIN